MQIVPPHGRAAFPITLATREPRAYSHKVEYILNGSHFMEFELNAEVQAVELLLSHTELDFSFSFDDWLPHVDRILLLENPNKFPALFAWDNPNPGLFNVAPMSGSVPPLASTEIAVRWAPSMPVQPALPGASGALLTHLQETDLFLQSQAAHYCNYSDVWIPESGASLVAFRSLKSPCF
jgi:hypothetical protein